MSPVRRHNPDRRRGSSLTEVLIAILIMSVGVLAVMALFPISIIRSIQATNLTNATILAKRADALVDLYGLVSDNFIPQPVEGDTTHAVIDPLGWHDMVAGGFGGLAGEYGNDGAGSIFRFAAAPYRTTKPFSEPPQFPGDRTDVVGGLVPLRRINYTVDPVNPGAAIYPTYASTGLSAFFNPPPAAVDRDAVLAAVGLPDNYNEVFRGEPGTFSATGAVFNEDLSFADTTTPKLIPGSRVVLLGVNGRRSQVRTYPGDGLVIQEQSPGVWEITWTDPVPAAFAAISELRIEFPQSRYTWMLTIRKRGISGGSVTDIDCVTFFNRALGDPNEEIVHGATFIPDPSDPAFLAPYTGNSPPADLLTIPFVGGFTPAIKKGGFLFDPTNCLWYRILDVMIETPTYAAVQLERDAEFEIPSVIIPQGVINVFPLPSRVDQSRLNSAGRF